MVLATYDTIEKKEYPQELEVHINWPYGANITFQIRKFMGMMLIFSHTKNLTFTPCGWFTQIKSHTNVYILDKESRTYLFAWRVLIILEGSSLERLNASFSHYSVGVRHARR